MIKNLQSKKVDVVCSKLSDFARRQLRRLNSALGDAVESGTSKDVHALRVASRRLNEPLRLMQSTVGRKAIRQDRRKLRELRRMFRHVRDLDVLGDTFREHEASGLIRPEQRATLMPILDAWRDAALKRACRNAGARRIGRTVGQVKTALKRFDKQGSRLQESMTRALDAQFNRRRAALESAAIGAGADLHTARIAVKKLRYCAELRHRLEVADHAPLIAVLTDAQNLLGHWNDQLTAAAWLTTLASNREMMVTLSSFCAELLDVAARVMNVVEADRDRIETYWPRVVAALDRPATTSSSRLQIAQRLSGDSISPGMSPASATPTDN